MKSLIDLMVSSIIVDSLELKYKKPNRFLEGQKFLI